MAHASSHHLSLPASSSTSSAASSSSSYASPSSPSSSGRLRGGLPRARQKMFDPRLRELAIRMRRGVSVTTRTKGLLKFEAVFMGNNAVSWMVAVSAAGSREEAVEIGAEMLRQKIIQRISVKPLHSKQRQRQEVVFKDSKKGFYRFNESLIATYLLHISIHEASHLLGKQRNGTSSPFVTVDTVHERCETRIIEDSVNPVWDESFKLAVNAPESEQIIIRVWNWQEIGADNFLGEVRIVLADIMSEIYDGSDGGGMGGGAGGGAGGGGGGRRSQARSAGEGGIGAVGDANALNNGGGDGGRGFIGRGKQNWRNFRVGLRKGGNANGNGIGRRWSSRTGRGSAGESSGGSDSDAVDRGGGGGGSGLGGGSDTGAQSVDGGRGSGMSSASGTAGGDGGGGGGSGSSLSDGGSMSAGENDPDGSMRTPSEPGSPSSRRSRSGRTRLARRYSAFRRTAHHPAEPFLDATDDEEADDEEEDESFFPETEPPARVKWYELQKRSERSNVQGDIAISLRLSDWSFSESLRQQSKAVFVGFRCGKVAVPPDNTHLRASRDQSPHVLIKGVPISASEITGGGGDPLSSAAGKDDDGLGAQNREDGDDRSAYDRNGGGGGGGLVRSLSSLFRSDNAKEASHQMLMSPQRMTQQRRHLMLYRALTTVTRWQLRINLLGCEGVKHAGMAKDMRVTTALLAVAPPVIRWKNYVVLRLDGFDDRSGHFRRQSKTVTKASGPSWNGEELVIDDIPTPLVGNVTLTLYQVIGLEIIHREVGSGSVLLNSIPRQLDFDNNNDGSNGAGGAESKSSGSAAKAGGGASQSASSRDSADGSVSWREQRDAIDVPMSLLAGLGTMSRVSNGVLRCTMTLTPSDKGRQERELVSDEIESLPQSIRKRRRRNPLSDAINPFRSSPAKLWNKKPSVTKGGVNNGTKENLLPSTSADCVPVDPGQPLKNQIVDMTVFMSVARITRLFFGYRGRFSNTVLDKQQKRQVKETYWMPSADRLRQAALGSGKSGSRGGGGRGDSGDGVSGESAAAGSDAVVMPNSIDEPNQPQQHSARGGQLRKRKPSNGKKSQNSSFPSTSSPSSKSFTVSSNAYSSHTDSNVSGRKNLPRARVKSVPTDVGDFRDVSYIASNQWSVACRVQCRQEVTQCDPSGGGIVVVETRRLPDIPYGRTFVLTRKTSIVFQAENVTRILISVEVSMLSHKSWPKGVESAIDSEITSMVRTEEKIRSDALMALDEGKSLRTLFQKPEEVAKEKTRRVAVLGITGVAAAIVAVILCWFLWNWVV